MSVPSLFDTLSESLFLVRARLVFGESFESIIFSKGGCNTFGFEPIDCA